MAPHQLRVIAEKNALDDKLFMLKLFLHGPVFLTLPGDERRRLRRQAEVMEEYSAILAERIVAFSDPYAQ